MLKLFTLIFAFLLLINSGNAQLKKTWKPQVYAGLSKSLRSKVNPKMDNYDLTFVSKNDWLFNSGFTYSKYRTEIDIPAQSGFNISAKPTTKFRQFNLSVGKRIDLSPKWSLSLYSGMSYTHCTFPTQAYSNNIKIGVYYPLAFSFISANYDTKTSLGLHLNSELNFYLCDNLMLYFSYQYDINSAHPAKGLMFGGRIGVLKQKYGSRRISAKARI